LAGIFGCVSALLEQVGAWEKVATSDMSRLRELVLNLQAQLSETNQLLKQHSAAPARTQEDQRAAASEQHDSSAAPEQQRAEAAPSAVGGAQQQQQQQPKTFAAAAAAQPTQVPHQNQNARPTAGPQAARGHGLLNSCEQRKRFVLQAPAQAIAGQGGREGAAAVDAAMRQLLPAAEFTLVDCGRMGSTTAQAQRFLVTVTSLWEAESLVKNRCLLKGTGYSLFDVLTKEEKLAHDRLWPRFLEARSKAGVKAQFNRARLFVDGKEVLP
jgi:flagellar biosynthesis GTPase FlhF